MVRVIGLVKYSLFSKKILADPIEELPGFLACIT
jgi:hypothetical protein